MHKLTRFYETAAIVLLILGVILSAPFAQAKDVQVMIAGPWSYVVDPSDSNRIVVIAPNESHHRLPIIFSGGDVANPARNVNSLHMGSYRLEINKNCSGSHSNSVNLFPISADVQSIIKPLIIGPSQRFAFSLPKPCYYTDVVTMRQHAIIDPVKSIPPGTPAPTTTNTPAYTTLMILHYTVSQTAPAQLTGTADDGSQYNFPTPFDSNDSSISLVMYGPPLDPYPNDCDSISATSVKASAWLFKNKLSVWQPSVDFGEQGDYVPGCQDNTVDENKIRIANQSSQILELTTQIEKYYYHPTKKGLPNALKALQSVRAQIAELHPPAEITTELDTAADRLSTRLKQFSAKNPDIRDQSSPSGFPSAGVLLPKSIQFLYFLTPSSADCRGAQLNINSAVP